MNSDTEQMRAELLNAAGVLLLALDPAGRITLANRKTVQFLGKATEADLLGKDWFSTVLRTVAVDRARASFLQVMAGERKLRESGDCRIQTDGGGERVIQWTYTLLNGTAREANGLLCSGVDVTERFNWEEALKENHRLLEAIMNGTADAVFVKDAEGRLIMLNQAVKSLLGMDPEEMLGKRDIDVFDAGVASHLVAADRKVMETGEPLTYEENFNTDSGPVTMLGTKTPYRDASGRIIGVIGIAKDITKRKAAEERLRESEARLTRAQELAGLGFVDWDLSTGEMIWSDEVFRVLGLDRDTTNASLDLAKRMLHPDDRQQVEQMFKAALSGEEDLDLDFRIERPDQSVVWVYARAEFQRDSSSGEKSLLVTVMDITERKLAELRHSLLATAIDQVNESILVTDTDGRIEYVNPAFERVSGFGRGEALGKNPRFLKSGRHRQSFYRDMWLELTGGRRWSGHFINRKKDGTEFHEEASISPIVDSTGAITNFVAVKRDVTHEAELESRLRQAQKMEAIGTLAGGIAHDFNNLLQAMLGYAVLAKRRTDQAEPAYGYLEQITDAGRRATELVTQILSFSRRNERRLMPVSLAVVVNEAVKLLKPTLPSTIEIRVQIERGCRLVLGDATELHQVVLNICTNAYQAMREKGGVLEILLGEITIPDEQGHVYSVLNPGEYARLEITDTGCGMDACTSERVFDPYFTSKRVGEGTGLGMATVLGIVEACGGTVSLTSQVGKGTRVEVLLPVSSAYDDSTERVSTPHLDLHGTESVLFVDDEVMLTELVKQDLEELGYRVESYSDSREALEVFTDDPARFDVVITDQTMPNLTGIDLARRILKIRSEVPIVLCTGYSELVDEDVASRAGIMQYVSKPVMCNELALAIREVCDARRSTPEDCK